MITWDNRDEAFQSIAEGIREVAISIRRLKGAEEKQGDKIGGDNYVINTVGNLNIGNVTIHSNQTSEP